VRGGAEVQEELEGLSELAARQEEIVECRDPGGRALAEPEHDGQVDRNDREVDGVEAPELHAAPGRKGRGRSDSP
jgi:hypothetical protein